MAKKQRVTVVGTVLTVEYPTIGKKFVVDYSKYAEAVRVCALAHGFKQKYGDAASGGTPAEKYSEVQDIHASLLAGEWERTATPDLTPIICEAIARIKFPHQKNAAEKLQKVAKPEQIADWGKNAKVKAEILKIRSERAAKAAEDADEIQVDL